MVTNSTIIVSSKQQAHVGSAHDATLARQVVIALLAGSRPGEQFGRIRCGNGMATRIDPPPRTDALPSVYSVFCQVNLAGRPPAASASGKRSFQD